LDHRRRFVKSAWFITETFFFGYEALKPLFAFVAGLIDHTANFGRINHGKEGVGNPHSSEQNLPVIHRFRTWTSLDGYPPPDFTLFIGSFAVRETQSSC